jgi:hypothetical protein
MFDLLFIDLLMIFLYSLKLFCDKALIKNIFYVFFQKTDTITIVVNFTIFNLNKNGIRNDNFISKFITSLTAGALVLSAIGIALLIISKTDRVVHT